DDVVVSGAVLQRAVDVSGAGGVDRLAGGWGDAGGGGEEEAVAGGALYAGPVEADGRVGGEGGEGDRVGGDAGGMGGGGAAAGCRGGGACRGAGGGAPCCGGHSCACACACARPRRPASCGAACEGRRIRGASRSVPGGRRRRLRVRGRVVLAAAA